MLWVFDTGCIEGSIPFLMEGQMDSDMLTIALFIVVALIAIAAGVYVVRPEK